MIGYYVPPPEPSGSLWAPVLGSLVILVIVFGPMLWLHYRDERTRRRVAEDRHRYGPGPR